MKSETVIAILETIKDIAEIPEMIQYIHDLENELMTVRGFNDTYIQIINNLKNRGK
jgi:hypothetical protein